MYRKYKTDEAGNLNQGGYHSDLDEDIISLDDESDEVNDSKGHKWLRYLNPFKGKDGKRLGGRKLVRRIITLCCLLALIILVIVSIYNSNVTKQYRDLVDTIDSRLDKYEYDFDTVKKVADILGVHDSDSYDAVLQEIDMSDAVRNKFFSSDKYTGTPTNAPTVEVLDVQYQYTPNEEERSYLLTVNVDYGTGSFKTYYMTCSFLQTTLTSLAIY